MPLQTVSMTAGSGGGEPSSNCTRPLTNIGCGSDVGWVVFGVLLVVGLVGRVGVVVGVPVGGVPVGGAAVPPPLFCPNTGVNRIPAATARVVAFTQTFGVIPPPEY